MSLNNFLKANQVEKESVQVEKEEMEPPTPFMLKYLHSIHHKHQKGTFNKAVCLQTLKGACTQKVGAIVYRRRQPLNSFIATAGLRTNFFFLNVKLQNPLKTFPCVKMSSH